VDTAPWRTDAGAPLLADHAFDASALQPQVAEPHSPAHGRDAGDLRGVSINLAYVGACTGAKFDDLRMAAEVLRGRRVARGVRLLVAPASAQDQARAAEAGIMDALADAGAELLPTSCGACAGYGAHTFGDDVVAISTTARNFKGRMGSAASRVYLASPWTVAASAVAGRVADPREMLA
jgi:3-isopropylmalate/(R)-2-methylmalate dehydratase large subunit